MLRDSHLKHFYGLDRSETVLVVWENIWLFDLKKKKSKAQAWIYKTLALQINYDAKDACQQTNIQLQSLNFEMS